MSVEEVTVVVVVQVLSWQLAGTVVLWWVPGWVLAVVQYFKQTQDVALDQGQQIRAVAWVVPRHLAGEWGTLALRELGT